MSLDPFSIENMKAELARAINKQADIQAMIDVYEHTNHYPHASVLILQIKKRNNQP